MRLRHIEVFNAVMLTGSVSGAARLINVTQPAVSRILQHAELQLGFALFQRSKGRLTATSEALTLYPHIERLFGMLDEVQRLAVNLRTGESAKELRLLTVLALSYEILPHAIKLFRVKHPEIAITVKALHSPQIVSTLALQEADVGFLLSPVTHPALSQQHLADGRVVCIAPKGMLSARLLKRGSVTLADLNKVPVIGLDVLDPVGRSLNNACREAEVGLDIAITVQTYHSALALAHHGLGVALVDSCTAASVDLKRVDVLALEPLIAVPIKALLPAAKPASVAVKSFVHCFQQALSRTGGAETVTLIK
ncbi:LysR family transcriptional regulator [Polaromonas sp. A23]|uniref:LysR family transcriptional regulator n=1 Tax=Polaromonas sp. A23 TaxID=1944133 RepID=UPI0009870FBE|nr:LysR substrate-binding domain-containing protein [Polaromonas sp. A23]OOG35847.1 LysR family transcriptional regulator [Polaromonas sp. A23]